MRLWLLGKVQWYFRNGKTAVTISTTEFSVEATSYSLLIPIKSAQVLILDVPGWRSVATI